MLTSVRAGVVYVLGVKDRVGGISTVSVELAGQRSQEREAFSTPSVRRLD